ncbi:MAG: hypothetical protein O2973_09445 [Gemmatimonadetes bacterium]|nr:hypothetical protein [Gemmatimonadota bacterium]
MSAHQAPSDRNAAFAGLIFGVIALAIVVVVVSKLTAKKFEGHEEVTSTASAMR